MPVPLALFMFYSVMWRAWCTPFPLEGWDL
jgi:hypothetical protein